MVINPRLGPPHSKFSHSRVAMHNFKTTYGLYVQNSRRTHGEDKPNQTLTNSGLTFGSDVLTVSLLTDERAYHWKIDHEGE